MLSEALRVGMTVRVADDAQHLPGMVGTVTQIYGDPAYVAAEVKFDKGRSVLYWHYEIDPTERQD